MGAITRFGIRRFLRAVVLAAVTIGVGLLILVEHRSGLCAPLQVVPGIGCPPLLVPATGAAVLALVVGVVVTALLEVARRGVIAWWRRAVDVRGEMKLPRTISLIAHLQGIAIVAALLLFAVFSSTSWRPEIAVVPTWKLLVTGALLVAACIAFASWRLHRLKAVAPRLWGIEFTAPPRPGPQRPGYSGYRPAPQGGYANGFDPYQHHGNPGHDSGSGWGGGWGSGDHGGGWGSGDHGGPIRDGFYGNGTQHGTRSFADDDGGLYGKGPQHGTSSAWDQPGGFYSNDPFGGRDD